MIQEILVPLDGSPFGEEALGPALEIAERARGRLHLVSACDPELAGAALLAEELSYEEEVQRYLEQLGREAIGTRKVDIETRVVTGSVVDALVDETKRAEIGLAVLSTHGHGPLSRLWMGSVADRFVRRAPCPVLLVRPREHGEEQRPDLGASFQVKHVLVPLDGSEVGDAVLDRATVLARLFDARLTLFSAVWLPQHVSAEHLPHVEWVDRGQLVENRVAATRTRLEEIRGRLHARDLEASVVVDEEAHPAEGILRFAEADSVDLIAMGTHGRGGVSRTILGSVADKVVRGSDRPVLLVRRPE